MTTCGTGTRFPPPTKNQETKNTMNTQNRSVSRPTIRRLAAGLLATLLLLATLPANGAESNDCVRLEYNTELLSLNLTGGPFPIPLASDPANALGDSINGYGLVDCTVTITLSSQRSPTPGMASKGQAFASNCGGNDAAATPALNGMEPIDPNVWDGKEFFIYSFFDVYYDITVTDVDARPGRDIAGMLGGASITVTDNGPAFMSSYYRRIFDKLAPNFGLIPPPEADPYIGHFNIEIPLAGDINGNGENDKVKFTFAVHSAGDDNRQFTVLPDGTTLDTFDSAAFLSGAIVDQSQDPPFEIGKLDPITGLPDPASFGGPTTATSHLLNPVINLFDICLQDDHKTRLLQINSTTGAYLYTDCATGLTYAGTGKVKRSGGKRCHLTLTDHRPGVKVHAEVDTCKHKGNANIQLKKPKVKEKIHDKDTTDNTCRCP